MIVRAAAVVVTLLVARSAAAEPPRWDVPTTHAVGLMTTMRTAEIFIWPEPFARFDPGGYERAFSQPPKWDTSQPAFEWDGDPWAVNVLGHGLFGSELYLRARHCRLGVVGSLLFTAAGSTVWEYGVEANGVRPSGFDLWFTPLSGLVVGEARYWAWRASDSVRQKTLRGILQALFDPLGELERFAGTPC